MSYRAGHGDPGERDAAQGSPRQRALAAVRLPVLLLHPRLLHVARRLPQQEGELSSLDIIFCSVGQLSKNILNSLLRKSHTHKQIQLSMWQN